MGIWPPENRGSSTAVLESVHLIGVIPGTRVLGIRVTPCGLRSDQGFPPEHVCDRAPLDPVAGNLDRPGPPPSGVRIVVGISAPRRGTFGFAGVSLTYRVGTRQYRAIYVQGGIICSGRDCRSGALDSAQQQILDLVAHGRFDQAEAVRIGH